MVNEGLIRPPVGPVTMGRSPLLVALTAAYAGYEERLEV